MIGLLRNSLLQFFFRLLYGPLAWTYDAVAATVSLGQWQAWVMSVLPYLSASPVLELGHGPGHLQAALSERGIQTFGLDPSRHMGRIASRRLLTRSLGSPLLITGYAQSMPFRDKSFSSVVATFPTEYVYDPRSATEIFRVLRPGGELIILPLAWIKPAHLLPRLAAGLFKVTGQSPAWDDRHLQPFQLAGFETSSDYIDRQGSRLLILRLRKPV